MLVVGLGFSKDSMHQISLVSRISRFFSSSPTSLPGILLLPYHEIYDISTSILLLSMSYFPSRYVSRVCRPFVVDQIHDDDDDDDDDGSKRDLVTHPLNRRLSPSTLVMIFRPTFDRYVRKT